MMRRMIKFMMVILLPVMIVIMNIVGANHKQSSPKVGSSTQVVPAYFGQHDKFYFNGNYYDLSANSVDKLAPADAVKANQSIKEKYPDAKLNKKQPCYQHRVTRCQR